MILFSTAAAVLLFATFAVAYNVATSVLQETLVKINKTVSAGKRKIELLKQEKSNSFDLLFLR